ncbi:hypothetical protein BOX15_Mlig012213g1, partial [Macrostomum lignano]
ARPFGAIVSAVSSGLLSTALRHPSQFVQLPSRLIAAAPARQLQTSQSYSSKLSSIAVSKKNSRKEIQKVLTRIRKREREEAQQRREWQRMEEQLRQAEQAANKYDVVESVDEKK